jgi:DNA-binding NarL/FixJ family response regulator
VLRLVATGLSYKQIAERLTLSHRTVQNHVQNTLTKLQLHNRVELVRYALDNGLGDGDGHGDEGLERENGVDDGRGR